MEELSNFKHENSVPYEERLSLAAERPLNYMSHHLSPIDDDVIDYNPTPLDPYNVHAISYDDGSHENTGAIYAQVASLLLDHRFEEYVEPLQLPEFVNDMVTDELGTSLNIRCERNNESMIRLKEALKQRPASDELLEIVVRARTGHAQPEELIRLVKEYPEMISAELYKLVLPFDTDSLSNFSDQVDNRISNLTETFESAEVKPHFGDDIIHLKSFVNNRGAYITEDNVCDLYSVDSHIQTIRKSTNLLLPPDVQAYGLQNSVRRVKVPGEKSLFFNVQPLSVSYYVRTGDYKQRLGYTPPQPDDTEMTNCAAIINKIGYDQTAQSIEDPEMRQAYVEQRIARLAHLWSKY